MSNIHYGLHLEEKQTTTTASEYDDTSLKSDIATNKTNIASNTSTLTSHTSTLSSHAGSITANSRSIGTNTLSITGINTILLPLSSRIATNTSNIATNTTNISTNTTGLAAVKSTADTNRQGILITPTSQINYHLYIPDLSNSYQTVQNIPNVHWPAPLMQFGAIDNETTFRLIGIVMDKDTVLPSTNFNVKFKIKGWTATGSQFDKELYQLNLSPYRITGKPYFSINKDITLRTKFLTEDIKCGMLYVKHMHGAQNITVEMIISCSILQF